MGSKKYKGWDTKPKLDEARVIAPETPPTPRAKKDRRRWCKGKVGVDHKLIIQKSKNSHYAQVCCGWRCEHHWTAFLHGKRWTATGEVFFSCRHQRACVNCGKILEHYGVGRECPDWTPKPEKRVCDCWSCTHRYANRT
ncbi:MAG TPA: hypothetical protein VH084_17550 [Mycobacterium sp.]|nr:hypothetical protein [Mycobacterium sp.]